MKPLKAILTSICLLLTFTSCVGSTTKPSDESQQNSASSAEQKQTEAEPAPKAKLLYMGHASLRITTPENKVIYIDPYAGKGYEAVQKSGLAPELFLTKPINPGL